MSEKTIERGSIMKMKAQIWNGHSIRFIEKEPGDWWAVAADVAKALSYDRTRNMARQIDDEDKGAHKMSTLGGDQEMLIISEFGVYDAVFGSRRPEAKQFKRWVKQVLLALRKASGLEGFQVFRMLDKEHQKEAMRQLRDGLSHPVQVDFIKANTIANKAVSTNYGYPRMLKKDQMTPDMLLKRQPILNDTVRLMEANDSFGLGLSVSDAVYRKYCH